MKKMIIIVAAFCAALGVVGCDVVQQARNAYNFVNCQYDFNSVSGISLGGIDLSGNSPGLAQITQLTALLSGKGSSIPLNMTVNIDVTNPNTSAAVMNGLQYILSVDNVELTQGSVDQALSVAAGGTSVLPLSVGVDLKSLISGDTGNTVLKAVKNIAGIGDESSRVTVKLKPIFKISDTPFSPSNYIPVSFDLGGK